VRGKLSQTRLNLKILLSFKYTHMYHPDVIDKNLKRAESLIKARHSLPFKWKFLESDDSQWEEMTSHFKGLVGEKGRLIRNLTPEEELWRLGERTRCKLDFGYYMRRYVKILDWSSRLVSFQPNIAQRIYLNELAKAEAKGHAQMYQILKARQEGFTTIAQILISHRVLFFNNVNALTGSASEPKSKKMVQKIEGIWNELPWWLRPRMTAQESGVKMEWGDLGSGVYVQWGNQKSGIGRGDTATVAHLSELASFINPEDLVDASLVRAMHENPFAFLMLESTAEGLGNWWHRTWQTMVKMDVRGIARFKPLFFPWYVARDLYPTEGWLKRRPVEEGWEPPDYVRAHAQAAERYVEQSEMLREALGMGWRLPIEQQWFYYLEFEEARDKRQLEKFLQEMPATPDEAFQASNPSVFSIETLTKVRTEVGSEVPEGAYQLGGGLVPPTFDWYRVQERGRGVRTGLKDEVYFNLDRVKLDGWPDLDTDGKIYIWEWPQDGEEYGIGVDPSEGIGGDGDDSVITVIKKATPWHPDEQVAEWASNRVGPHDLWMWLQALAYLYVTRKRSGGMAWPHVVVETNIGAGDACQTEIIKRGWPTSSLHQDVDLTSIKNAQKKLIEGTARLGWRTTRANRPKAISIFRKMVRDGSFIPRSPKVVEQMATLEYNLDRQRIEASVGNHDDRIIAPSILLCSWYDPEVRGQRGPQAWEEARKQEDEVKRRPRYVSGEVGGRPRNLKPEEGFKDSRNLYTLLEV